MGGTFRAIEVTGAKTLGWEPWLSSQGTERAGVLADSGCCLSTTDWADKTAGINLHIVLEAKPGIITWRN